MDGTEKTPGKSGESVAAPPATVNNDGPEASAPLEWTVHPLSRAPMRGVLVLSVLLVVEFAVAIVWESPWLAVLAALVLVAATGRFLFATHHRLDDEGVEVRFLGTAQRRPWTELRRYREARDGVLLTPFRRRTVLDETRGVFIRFGAAPAGRDEVMRVVRRRIGGTGEP